jgi:hypothetical protein
MKLQKARQRDRRHGRCHASRLMQRFIESISRPQGSLQQYAGIR